MPTVCFWLEPLNFVRRNLRRYASIPDSAPRCRAGFAFHNAETPFDVVPVQYKQDQFGHKHLSHALSENGKPANDDPRWARKCEHCDYEFLQSDPHRLFVEDLYRCSDTGAVVTVREAPPGALWDAWWMSPMGDDRSPDGIPLMAKCPDGSEWFVDGPATNGPGWTRTGAPPNFTVQPSIATGRDHGFLVNGVFSDPL